MSSASSSTKTWFGHPPQLARLFVTEMWERFGFYGMRCLLTLYLAKHFLFSDNVTQGLYGAFTALVYLTPLFGGMLADQYLGSKRSVKLGALLMATGYFGLCFGGSAAIPKLDIDGKRFAVTIPSEKEEDKRQIVDVDGVKFLFSGQEDGSAKLIPVEPNSGSERVLAKGTFKSIGERNDLLVSLMFMSLACVIVGNGFFKPNISTIVGSLYSKGDNRRDAGFTMFYLGINLGSMFSQLICPILAVSFGWWAGFLLAACGMVTAFCLFQFDGGRLKGYGDPPEGKQNAILPIYIGAICAVPLMWFLIRNTMLNAEAAAIAAKEGASFFGYISSLPILGKLLFAVFISSTIGVPIWAYFNGSKQEFQKMVVAIVLVVFSVVFWTLFEQAGSSLTLFAERNTNREVNLGFWSYTMPAGQVQVFNALFIVIFAPIFSWLWLSLARKKLEPSIPIKFAIALASVGIGFLALVYGSRFVDDKFQVGLIWLVLAYLIHSIAELCISPVGLSMITKLSIARVVGLMMGVWFMCTAVAQYVGGIVATFASVETVGGEVTNPKLALATYVGVFSTIGWASIAFGVVLLVFSPFLKRMMHDVR